MVAKRPLIDRFMEKVDCDHQSGCWIWIAAVNTHGYGIISTGSRLDKTAKVSKAHRVSYELFNGKISNGYEVCHRCDNPKCVNPAHLFLGTHGDNMRDMSRKGRHVSPNSKKTHCRFGHEYSESNTRYYKSQRHCRACDKVALAKYRHKKKSVTTTVTMEAM